MTRPFTLIIHSKKLFFQGHPDHGIISHFNLLKVTKTVWFGFAILFFMSTDTSNKNLLNIYQPGHFDLCQSHSNNGHSQWKSVACTLKFI